MKNSIGLFKIFVVFFRMGAMTFGGGFAMLPIIERIAVEEKGWFKEEEVVNSFALAQSIPGIIAVNTSALLGYKLRGIKGTIASCLGAITPSVIVILIISRAYESFSHNMYVINCLKGIRIAVLALLINTLWNLIIKSIQDKTGAIMAIAAFCGISFLKISPVYIILAGVLLSFIIYGRTSNGNIDKAGN